MGIKVIITGTTGGMVGEGILLECLTNSTVEHHDQAQHWQKL